MPSQLVNDLLNQIKHGRVAVVIGTGVSIGTTGGNVLASWTGLLENAAERCANLSLVKSGWKERVLAEIHSGDIDDLLSAAEKVSAKLGGSESGENRRWLRDTVGSLRVKDPEVIEALHALGVPLTTTNYDGLIEEVTKLVAITWREGATVERLIRGDKEGVLHLHGYWAQPESVVFSIRSYEQVLGNAHAQAVLRALQAMKTLVFVGFDAKLRDPNFDQLLRWTGAVFSGSECRRFRLAKESEVADLQKEHSPEQRLFVLPFGKSYVDLAPFLRQLYSYLSPGSILTGKEDPAAMLPPAPRCFGRKDELEELVMALLAEGPSPVPILGPPGIGKTTVALAALHDPRVVQRYDVHRHFIRCDGIKSREALSAQVGLALKLEPGPNIEVAIIEALRISPTVLVIDNVETAWMADTLRVEEFFRRLASIPGLALVVSIRGLQRPFGIWWGDAILMSSLSRSAARDAFLAIAGEKFKDDPRLDDLLRALDYVPLAVMYLAYATEGEPNLDGIWKRWHQERTDMLRRAAGTEKVTNIQVSYEIAIKESRITDKGRRLLALMAFLPDGVTSEELEQIFPVECNQAASELRQAGLAFDEYGRFRVLTPLREYVIRTHVPDSGDLKRLVEFYIQVAVEDGPRVGGNDGLEVVRRLASQAANIENALSEGFKSNDPESAIRGALALVNFIRFAGVGSAQLLEKAVLAAQSEGKLHSEADCITALAYIALDRLDYELVQKRFDQALRLYRMVGDFQGQANCVKGMSDVALDRADYNAARTHSEEALMLYRHAGDVTGQADCIRKLAQIARFRSDYESARSQYEQALSLYRQLNNVTGEANCTRELGWLALSQSNYEAAQTRFEKALTLDRQIGSLLGEANSIKGLAKVALGRSDSDTARARFLEVLALYQGIPDLYSIGLTHRELAGMALDPVERKSHLLKSKDAWKLIQRDDLIDDLKLEFDEF